MGALTEDVGSLRTILSVILRLPDIRANRGKFFVALLELLGLERSTVMMGFQQWRMECEHMCGLGSEVNASVSEAVS